MDLFAAEVGVSVEPSEKPNHGGGRVVVERRFVLAMLATFPNVPSARCGGGHDPARIPERAGAKRDPFPVGRGKRNRVPPTARAELAFDQRLARRERGFQVDLFAGDFVGVEERGGDRGRPGWLHPDPVRTGDPFAMAVYPVVARDPRVTAVIGDRSPHEFGPPPNRVDDRVVRGRRVRIPGDRGLGGAVGLGEEEESQQPQRKTQVTHSDHLGAGQGRGVRRRRAPCR